MLPVKNTMFFKYHIALLPKCMTLKVLQLIFQSQFLSPGLEEKILYLEEHRGHVAHMRVSDMFSRKQCCPWTLGRSLECLFTDKIILLFLWFFFFPQISSGRLLEPEFFTSKPHNAVCLPMCSSQHWCEKYWMYKLVFFILLLQRSCFSAIWNMWEEYRAINALHSFFPPGN